MLGEGSAMGGVLASVDIDADETLRRAFNAGKAQGHTPILIGAAKAAAVAPGSIEMIIRPPGHRPQIATGGRGLVCLPMPGNAFDHRAGRVGRLYWLPLHERE